MKQVFSAEGWRTLRTAWLLLAVCIVAGAAIIVASHWLLRAEERGAVTSRRLLNEATVRLANVRRERDNFEQSLETFRKLVERGLLRPEQRLDLVERMNDLRARHRLMGLEYEIDPQRRLVLADGKTFSSVDLLASRVKLRLRALHEGDVLAFIEGLANAPSGFYSVDRCVMRRMEATAATESLQPRIEADCALEWITLKEKRAG